MAAFVIIGTGANPESYEIAKRVCDTSGTSVKILIVDGTADCNGYAEFELSNERLVIDSFDQEQYELYLRTLQEDRSPETSDERHSSFSRLSFVAYLRQQRRFKRQKRAYICSTKNMFSKSGYLPKRIRRKKKS